MTVDILTLGTMFGQSAFGGFPSLVDSQQLLVFLFHLSIPLNLSTNIFFFSSGICFKWPWLESIKRKEIEDQKRSTTPKGLNRPYGDSLRIILIPIKVCLWFVQTLNMVWIQWISWTSKKTFLYHATCLESSSGSVYKWTKCAPYC